jgi:hypothetical protein
VSHHHHHRKSHDRHERGVATAHAARIPQDPTRPALGLFTAWSKFGLFLAVMLSLGLGYLLLLAPPPKGHKSKPTDAALAKADPKDVTEDKPAEKTEKTKEKPAEKKPAEKTEKTEKTKEKPAEKKPADKSMDKPVEKKPADKSMDKPADKSMDKPVEKKPADKSMDKPVEKKPADKSMDKPVEKKPAEKPPEKPPEKKPAETKPEDTATAAVLFEKDVLPVFMAKCVKCHGGNSTKKGVDVRTMKTLLAGGDGGPAIVRGDLKKSLLWDQIDSEAMPPDDKLTAQEKETIRKWILGGAKTAKN